MGDVSGLELTHEDPLSLLYEQTVGRAEALARALTGDAYLAQDIAHEAFVRVAGRFGHLRQAGAFEAYLRTAVVNLCRSHFRRARVEERGLKRMRITDATAPARNPEDRDALWAAILTLPYRQRAAIVQRFYEDLSEQQTGAILRCSPRAVNALVSRAMATLRREVEEPE